MRDPSAQIGEWTKAGRRVALATVVEVTHSAPRPVGSKLAVAEDGDTVGAVSGGCVEGVVIAEARRLLAGDGRPRLLHLGIEDEEALGVGLPCGGIIDVLVELVGGPEQAAFHAAGADGETAALVGAADGGAKLLIRGDGSRRGTLGAPELDAAGVELAEDRLAVGRSGLATVCGRSIFCDVAVPAPRLLLFGAVDYAAAICRLAAASGWRPFVIDPRRAFVARESFAGAERVIARWPREAIVELGGLDAATAVVVLTHDPKLDDEALCAALESPARFIGAMGSRISCERREERLRAAGLDDEQLARISAPVGLDLGAISPAETALSVFAEIVAAANGRGGGRLAETDGRIHATA